jgi:hypothetical protein
VMCAPVAAAAVAGLRPPLRRGAPGGRALPWSA